MNVGSLFSGIGGIDLGLERVGMRVLWQVECDPYARARVSRRIHRLACLGNACVPQVAEWIGRQILAHAEEAVTRPRQLQLEGPDKDDAA